MGALEAESRGVWRPDRGVTCPGCAEGDVPQHPRYVHPQNPVHGNGVARSQVSSGPNKGLWWVGGVTVDVKMASALNPDYLPGGVQRPHGCGASSQLSLYDFNLFSCGRAGNLSTWPGTRYRNQSRETQRPDPVTHPVTALSASRVSTITYGVTARRFESGRPD